MPLTTEERRAINQRNARRSTGPTTPEGRAKASRNALKHGLRAETLALPGEDAAKLQELTEEWVEYYQPASPAQRALLDRAVYATMQQQRCARVEQARLAQQVREAQDAWDRDRAEEVARAWGRLEEDPAGAVRALKRTAAGCARLIDVWEGLQYTLQQAGSWFATDRRLATRLLGWRPDSVGTDDNAYWIKLLNLSAAPEANEAVLEQMTRRDQTPDRLWTVVAPGEWLDKEYSRKELCRMVEEQLAALRAEAERLLAAIDDPARDEVGDRAAVLQGDDAAVLTRYLRMHDAMFHRAYKGLLQAQAAEEASDPHPAAEPPAVEPTQAQAPSEADPAAPNEPSPTVPVVPVMRADASEPAQPEPVETPPQAADRPRVGVETPRVA